jgi:hypothetical protein
MIRSLLFLGVVTIPFSAISGLGAFGELGPELSTYFFFPAVGIGLLARIQAVASPESKGPPVASLVAIFVAAIGIMSVSFVANANSITSVFSHGRWALEKFAASLTVILYDFALAYVVFSKSGHEWHRFIFKPIAISAMLCVGFSVLEIFSRHLGIADGIFEPLDTLVHGGWSSTVYEEGWDQRIRSVAFEAPAFGNYVGFAWPWLTAAWVGNKAASRRGYFVVWLLITALQIYSPSRTGIVMMGGSAIILALLHVWYLPSQLRRARPLARRLMTTIAVACILVAFGVGMSEFQDYERSVIGGSEVSNLTRLSYTKAAFGMMMDHPFFGLGLGQFAFSLLDYLPSWGYLSYEVKDWASGDTPVLYWPATYSVYGRLACELGAMGLLGWIALWCGLGVQILRRSVAYQRLTGSVPAASYPLIVSCFCVLLSGFTTDTFRNPMIWMALGLSCRYLADIRSFVKRGRGLCVSNVGGSGRGQGAVHTNVATSIRKPART